MKTKKLYSQAYLQNPSLNVSKNIITFSTDDDLWCADLNGQFVKRLTNSKGFATLPRLSPSGEKIAYLGTQSGQREIYLMSSEGGIPKRLTFQGVLNLCGWNDEKHLIFTSHSFTFSPRVTFIYSLNVETLEVKELNYGHVSSYTQTKDRIILGRNTGDPARWKRYRGGTAGTLWLQDGKGPFKQILKNLKSNLANPQWIGHSSLGKNPRLFFISDHEGIGNIYSCNISGGQVLRHTDSDEYYVRNFSYDQGIILYQAGGDLFKLDLSSQVVSPIEISIPSSFNQSTPRVEDAEDYLQEYTLKANAQKISVITRGQLFIRSPWNAAPIHLGDAQKRYKTPTFINQENLNGLLAIELNEENEESLKFFTYDPKKDRMDSTGYTLFPKFNWGKIQVISVHPKKDIVALSNNRNELYLIHLKTKKMEKIASNSFHFYTEVSWSPCGHLLTYSEPKSRTTHEIQIYHLKTKKAKSLIPSVLSDSCPKFDPNGEYLYFIGIREFHPTYSESHFDLGFPFATKVYAVALQNDLPSPLEQYDNFDFEEEGDSEAQEEVKAEKKPGPKKKVTSKKVTKKVTTKITKKEEDLTEIDWVGIENRIFSLPIPLGGYKEIEVVEDKIFILKEVVKGLNPHREAHTMPTLYTYCLKDKKLETYQKSCSGFEVSLDRKYILMDTEDGLRLTQTDIKPSEGDEINKKDGHIDLSNIRLYVDPKSEWKQMYQEAWILQREHFWNETMSRINWKAVYLRYLPLLDKVHTRKEFSDLMWEMQGELGTSHCYEFGGDYHRRPKNHTPGHFGARLKWNQKDLSFTIIDLPTGDSWIPEASSPLRQTGVQLEVGDTIYGLDGRRFTQALDLNTALIGRNGQKLYIEVRRKGKKESEDLEVTVRSSHHLARYRDWVNQNKEFVHIKSKGKVGYIHIPDMGVQGFSEFYRNFLSECTYEGLIVDVRYNGGGHISQHLLKILAQNVVGFDKTRYMGIEPYPAYAINGPIVALTNEHAGSDGDIFSHSFKLMKIGPLIGKRTWGGVVGIWPRHSLNDGTMTSQPEFSFWFKDVGYQVENYGTDPDIEVENTPDDWSKGLDQQLLRAISEVQKLSKKSPPLKPNLNQGIPNLKAPKLPKR